MSILPALPLNWRRDVLDRASQFLVNIPQDPNRPKNAQESEALELGAMLQRLLHEEAKIERDPKLLEVYPGMSVGYQFGKVVREFLVVECLPAGDGKTYIYGSGCAARPAPCIEFSRVLWVRSSDQSLIWQASERSDS